MANTGALNSIARYLTGALVAGVISVVCGVGYLIVQAYNDLTPAGQANLKVRADTAKRLSADQVELKRLEVERKRLAVRQLELENRNQQQ